MNMRNVFNLGFLFLLPLSSFGVKINGKDIPVKNRNDMKKVYRAIEPMIKEKKYELAAKILAKAYMEYATFEKNLGKDQKEGYLWLYLGNASKYYVRYNKNAKELNEQQYLRLKATVHAALLKSFPKIDQNDLIQQ
ncbi:MAG: hypothetical protein LBI77_02770 [Puniceicoccales bacterium]|jgi:hypothetical protein|nr:hypothetical protein [Puniceicoccales bacterium]